MFCKSPQWKISLQEPQGYCQNQNNVQSVVSAAHEVNEI